MTAPDISVTLENVSKVYCIWSSPASHLAYSLGDAITSRVGLGRRVLQKLKQRASRDFVALQPLNLEIKKGTAIGILGRNGSGKSTLLQIIAGTLYPTQGQVRSEGKIGALLELGCGFNPDFTGRENIYLSAALLGASTEETKAKIPSILEFAEIGEFIDQPVKTYSSGMFMRLAFSIHVVFRPGILIIDEALGVGDIFFQQKCNARLRALMAEGTTVIFVSHDMGAVLNLCERAILLNAGQLLYDGNPEEAVNRYLAISAQESNPPVPTKKAIACGSSIATITTSIFENNVLPAARSRIGTRKLELIAASLLNENHQPIPVVPILGRIKFECLLRANAVIQDPQIGIGFHDCRNNEIFCAGTPQLKYPLPPMQTGQWLRITFEVEMTVAPGLYTYTLIASETGAYGPNSGMFYDVHSGLGPIQVTFDKVDEAPPFNGMAQMPMRFCEHQIFNADAFTLPQAA